MQSSWNKYVYSNNVGRENSTEYIIECYEHLLKGEKCRQQVSVIIFVTCTILDMIMKGEKI